MSTDDRAVPPPGGDPETLAALQERLAARGLKITPASEVPAAAGLPEDGHEAQARRERRAQHYQDRWAKRLPAMYETASLNDLDDWVAGDTASDARKVTTWLAAEASPTLILAGSVGTGKTHAAYAIGNAAVRRGIWTEAWTVTELLEAMRPNGDASVARDVRRCPLLVLDDLGAAKATDWAVDALTTLVDARLREHRRQIVTTNHPYEVLEASWGGRLMDRLAHRWTVVTLTGPSRRRGW